MNTWFVRSWTMEAKNEVLSPHFLDIFLPGVLETWRRLHALLRKGKTFHLCATWVSYLCRQRCLHQARRLKPRHQHYHHRHHHLHHQHHPTIVSTRFLQQLHSCLKQKKTIVRNWPKQRLLLPRHPHPTLSGWLSWCASTLLASQSKTRPLAEPCQPPIAIHLPAS